MSMMTNAMIHLRWHHDDPNEARQEILKALGDISWIRLVGSQVLLASYMRPVKTRGGFISGTQEQGEDIFQGTVGMVVAIGPQAWRATTTVEETEREIPGDEERFGGRLPRLGDWIYCRPQDTVMCAVKGPGSQMDIYEDGKPCRQFEGWPCKLVYSRDIYAIVELPHAIL